MRDEAEGGRPDEGPRELTHLRFLWVCVHNTPSKLTQKINTVECPHPLFRTGKLTRQSLRLKTDLPVRRPWKIINFLKASSSSFLRYR